MLSTPKTFDTYGNEIKGKKILISPFIAFSIILTLIDLFFATIKMPFT